MLCLQKSYLGPKLCIAWFSSCRPLNYNEKNKEIAKISFNGHVLSNIVSVGDLTILGV